jgi:hypothetical protein
MADDTISFVVTAPAGFLRRQPHLCEQGFASTVRTAQQSGNTQWTVAGFPGVIGGYNGNPTLIGVVDLTALLPASVPVSITVSQVAGPTGDVEGGSLPAARSGKEPPRPPQATRAHRVRAHRNSPVRSNDRSITAPAAPVDSGGSPFYREDARKHWRCRRGRPRRSVRRKGTPIETTCKIGLTYSAFLFDKQ